MTVPKEPWFVATLLIAVAVSSASATFDFCHSSFCFSSDGVVHPVSSVEDAQKLCETPNDSSSRLLEIYDEDLWTAVKAGTAGASNPMLLNTLVTWHAEWTSIFGTPLPGDYVISNNIQDMDYLYLTRTGGGVLSVNGGDRTVERAYVCMNSGNCSPSQNGYSLWGNCYTKHEDPLVLWFAGESACWSSDGRGGHLATFENVPIADLEASALGTDLTHPEGYWIGVSKISYEWLSSKVRMNFSSWSIPFPLNSGSPGLREYVYFDSADDRGWKDSNYHVPNSFEILCMRDTPISSTSPQPETSAAFTTETTDVATTAVSSNIEDQSKVFHALVFALGSAYLVCAIYLSVALARFVYSKS